MLKKVSETKIDNMLEKTQQIFVDVMITKISTSLASIRLFYNSEVGRLYYKVDNSVKIEGVTSCFNH